MLLEHTALTPSHVPVRDLVAEANHRIANSLSAIGGLVQQQISALKPDTAAMPAADVKRDARRGPRAGRRGRAVSTARFPTFRPTPRSIWAATCTRSHRS